MIIDLSRYFPKFISFARLYSETTWQAYFQFYFSIIFDMHESHPGNFIFTRNNMCKILDIIQPTLLILVHVIFVNINLFYLDCSFAFKTEHRLYMLLGTVDLAADVWPSKKPVDKAP